MQDCAILNQCLEEVARQYPATKFVKIVSTGAKIASRMLVPQQQFPHRWQHGCAGRHHTALPVSRAATNTACCKSSRAIPPFPSAAAECIPGYPDANLPTVLLYRDTKCVQTLVGLRHFGGRSTSPELVSGCLCHL